MNVLEPVTAEPRAGPGDHPRRQVDGDHTAAVRILVESEAGACADFQNRLPGCGARRASARRRPGWSVAP